MYYAWCNELTFSSNINGGPWTHTSPEARRQHCAVTKRHGMTYFTWNALHSTLQHVSRKGSSAFDMFLVLRFDSVHTYQDSHSSFTVFSPCAEKETEEQFLFVAVCANAPHGTQATGRELFAQTGRRALCPSRAHNAQDMLQDTAS